MSEFLIDDMTDTGDVRIALRRQPILGGRIRPLLLATFFVTIFGLMEAVSAVMQGQSLRAAAELILPAVGLGVILLFFVLRRFYVRRREMPMITVSDTHLTIPNGIESIGISRVPIKDIRSVVIGGQPGRMRLLIETWRQIFLYNEQDFHSPDAPVRIVAVLRDKLQALPEGEAILGAMQKRQDFAQKAIGVRPWVTQGMLGLLAVFFANQILSGNISSGVELLRWGGVSGYLVAEGEVYRLVAGNFLHGGIVHFLLNAIALYMVGGIVERLFGGWRFAVIYLVSGLVATSFSALFMDAAVSVGASGAVFGVLGALAAVNLRLGAMLPLGFRQPRRVWILLAGINIAIPLLFAIFPQTFPQIDVMAHGGGLLAGFGIALLFLQQRKTIAPNEPASLSIKGTAIVFGAIFAVGLAMAVQRAAVFDDAAQLRLSRALVGMQSANPIDLNVLAWLIAIEPRSTDEALRIAQSAAERAVAAAPEQLEFRDTLATVHYRQGRFRRAVEEQHDVMQRKADGVYASQLARFIAAAKEAEAGWPSGEAVVRVSPKAEDPKTAVVRVDNARIGLGATVYVLVTRNNTRLGLLRLRFGAGAQAEYELLPKDNWRLTSAPEIIRYHSAYLVNETPEGLGSDAFAWDYWPTDRRIIKYP